MVAAVHHGDKAEAFMKLERVATPRPQKGEILVRVASCGVCRPDLLQKSGSYPAPPGSSPYLGLEVSGVVVDAS